VPSFKGHNFSGSNRNIPCRKCGKFHHLRCRKGENNSFFGKHHSDASKQKIALGNIGKSSYWKGKSRNTIKGENNPAKRLAVRAKISAYGKGRKKPWVSERNKNPSFIEKVRKKRIGAKHPISQRALEHFRSIMSKALSGEKNPAKQPNARKKISDHLSGKPKTEAHKKALSVAITNLWASSKYRNGLVFSQRSVESKKHHELKLTVKRFLEERGFHIRFEKPIMMDHKCYIIDVYGKKGTSLVAVECGTCDNEKLRALERIFTSVIHLPYGTQIDKAWLNQRSIIICE
jgi:hypothetical protein